MRRVEHGLAVALAEVPRPGLLEDGRHVRAAARPQDAVDLREVGALVGDVLHDHRRDRGIERAARNVGDRVGGRRDGVDPRKASRHTSEPRRLEVDGIDRLRRVDELRRARARRTAARRRIPGRRARAGPGASERASRLGSRSTSKWTAVSVYRSLTRRGYAPPGRQSPVSPSQQPILNRHRGHWNVPCRHSMCAPQRRQISTISRAGSAATRPP